jgi:putative flippase GtrA
MNVLVVIPAYEPGDSLSDLAADLSSANLDGVLVVDDGSGPAFGDMFAKLKMLPRLDVLKHAVNLGKGAALKTGINHAACQYPGLTGIVTADADGQHLAADILRVARELEAHPSCLVLGARRFGRGVPWRSRVGNLFTRLLLRLVVGLRLQDTQTGLRGVPSDLMLQILKLRSQGYELELDMLVLCKQTGRQVIQIEIETVYKDGNRGSHFNPLVDSAKVYFVLFRFLIASLLTAGIDSTVFVASHLLGVGPVGAQVAGRVAAVSFNYNAVRSAVFYSGQSHREAVPKYLLLVAVSGFISYSLMTFLASRFSVHLLAAKMLAESFMFLANFAIQRDFIFTGRRGD